MTDQHSSERSIFLAAIDQKSPAERGAFLEQACGENPGLRAEVEALLAAHDRLPGVPPTATVDSPTPAEVPGAMIGPYKLLQQIGEGGMGTVYMAEQTQPVQRKVALKVIKAGLDSKQVIARFEAERQALAMMDHVNIARVFDGGTTSEVRDQKSEVRKEKAYQSPLTSDLCPLTSALSHRPCRASWGRRCAERRAGRGCPVGYRAAA